MNERELIRRMYWFFNSQSSRVKSRTIFRNTRNTYFVEEAYKHGLIEYEKINLLPHEGNPLGYRIVLTDTGKALLEFEEL